MKKKDIITIVISVAIMIGALFFGLRMLGIGVSQDKSDPADALAEVENIYVPGEIDQATIDELNKFNDYGEATLDNIGRADPFGPL